MARLIPQKQIEEINQFRDSISIANSVFISGSLLVSQSIDIGSNPLTKQRITGSVEITGSLEIDGPLTFANAESRLDATASFADISVDTQLFGGIRPEDFGAMDATLYVSSTSGDDNNDGRTPQFPLRTIKKAAKIATDGDDGRFGLPTGSLFTGFRIEVAAGTYLEDNPIELPKNTTVWGAGLRVTKVLAKNETEDLFWVNSGNYLAEMTFGNLRVFPSVDNSQKGFAVSFAPNAFITTSPYVQNCSMISNQENSFLEAYEDIPPGGGGLNVDGNRIHPDSPLASMVLDAYTQVAPNGVGCQVVGRGFIQLVSFFTNFSAYSVKVLDGGQAVLLNSNTSFGDYGMYASGSRFITGSQGNNSAFLNVQDNYSIIINTIEDGLSAIPALVPNTNDGIRATSPDDYPQYFTNQDSTQEVAEIVKSDFRLISSIVESGDTNIPTLIAKSSTKGYSPTSVYNISGQNQITSSVSASSDDINFIDTNFNIVLDIIELGNAATSSYTQISNVSESIKVTTENTPQLYGNANSYVKTLFEDRFDTILSIVDGGLRFTPQNIVTNTSASFKFSDLTPYETDISSSFDIYSNVSSSLSIVYNILANGTGSLPTTINSSSVENPQIEYQNAYTLLKENIEFIQEETILYLSSSWSEFEYNQDTCKRDIGYIISGAAHDLLYGGNEESLRSGIFYYQFPSDATTTQKDPTLDGVKYASELALNILSNKQFRDTEAGIDTAYDIIFDNKDFVRDETIAYISSSWSEFEYNESKCRRDIGYVLDAIATDIKYGGNERSVKAGQFYYLYPSLATVDNRTVGQKQQTLDGLKYAKRITQKLLENTTFVTASASRVGAVELIRENRSLIQDETITYINTKYPNFEYNQTKCRRDVGYIVDNVATDLLYGGNERSELAGLYYFLYPSVANTTQLTETLEGVRYANGITKEIAASNLLETPKIVLNTDGNIRVTSFEPTSSLVSAGESEVKIVSQSFGIIEDIIRYGTDSIKSSIAINSDDFVWDARNPINVSSFTQITSSNQQSSNLQTIEDNFKVVTDIIGGGTSTAPILTSSWDSLVKVSDTEQYLNTGSVASSTQATLVSASISIIANVVQNGTGSLPTLDENTNDLIKVGDVSQTTSLISASAYEVGLVSESFASITNIVENGTGSIPTIEYNTSESIKFFNDSVQFTGSLSGSLEDIEFISASISIVTNIIANGTGSLPTITPYSAPVSVSSSLAAYEILRENIDFIQDETIAYLSSSWSTASYDEAKCRRDIGYIISGAAEDLVWNSNSASVVNGEFYYQIPSQAQGAQLNQTLDGIFYASRLAQKLIQNEIFVTASAERRAAWDLIDSNIDFIKEETILYLSSSWSTFDYNEVTCRRDVGYILDAVKTDIYWGGNERSNKAGEFYYLYPSQATIANDGDTGGQLNQTLDGIRYAGRIVESVVQSISLSSPSQAVLDAKELLELNKQFIKDEVIEFVSSSWNDFSYNQTTCKRDVGYILDAAITDLVYGGNERSRVAAEYYYRYPSAAVVGGVPSTTQQKDPTVDAIKYLGGISEQIVLGGEFTSADTTKLSIRDSIVENKAYIQQNVVEYINDTYPYLTYNKSKCYRDIGFIVDAVVTDLVYGGNARSTQAGVFYYLFPSQATDSQKRETIDGINFGRDLAKLIVKGAKSIEDNFDDIITIIESGSSITTEQTIGTNSTGAPISTVGIPKNSYGDNLITTVTGTALPDGITYVGNAENGIRFESGSQYTSEVTASSSEITKVSSSFSIVRDIIEYGISGSLQLTGSSDASTYFEVVTLEQGSYYFNKSQLQKFDDVDGKILGEDTGSFSDGVKDPTLTLKRGELYTFSINSLNIVNTIPIFTKPFYIKRDRSAGDGNLYNEGITNNGTTFGTITFIVPFDAPDRLYYVNGNDVSASGIIDIVDVLPISDTQQYVDVPSRGEFEVITNNVDGIKVNDITQYKNPYTASAAESRLVSSSFATVVAVITNGTGSLPTLVKSVSGNIKKSSITQYTSSIDATNGIINRVTSSFDIVYDVIKNGLSSLPALVENTTDLIRTTSTTQYTSSLSGSSSEVSNVSSSYAIVLDILNNGTGSLPTRFLNTESSIKFDKNLVQFTGSLSGSLEDVNFVSSSISIVTEIISVGSGSYLTASLYDTGSGASTDPATLAAYEILRSNIGFIQSESIAYLSSSWTTASYDESKCIRDIGLIISGAAEDLIWNTYSASIVNGKYYLEFPSQAETSQLNQTLDGIFYASRLAQKLIQNTLFVTASTEVSASYNLIRENREFIKDETIAYLSSSWSTFDYSETLCRRDVGHMIDAVSTDLFYGGNERSIIAGEFYYKYPSQATGSQLNQTTDGINYARRITEQIVNGSVFASAPESRTNGYDLLFNNRELIQTEVVEYISSSWADFDYDDVKCKRDVGYIVDAVATDLVYGGNERSREAGRFYYLYPSQATGSQLLQTLDGVEYAKNISIELLQNNVFQNASEETIIISDVITQNKDLIKAEVISYISSSWSTFEYNQAKCERDTGYIIDAVVTDFYYGGNERSRTAGEFYYLYPSLATDSTSSLGQLNQTVDGIEYAQRLTNKLINNVTLVTASAERQATYDLLFQNKSIIQDEVIHYISSSWVDFEYIESKCRRDVGYIIDAVATDVLYGGNERSVTAGEFYYLYPSEATTVQSDQTITGVVHAAGLADKIIRGQLLVTASADIRDAYDNILNNKELIQDNVIEFVDMTYPYFTYNRVKCRRDVGYIVDAIATDLLWGGNQRSVIAGDYYYRFPSQATTTQLRETTLAIRYAKEIVKDLILNNVLESPRVIYNTENNIRFTDTEQYSGSMAISGSNLTNISSSFSTVVDVISNGLSSLPTEVRNVDGLIKVTNSTQITSSINSGSDTEVGIISASIGMINDIIRFGSDDIPFALAKWFYNSELDTPKNLTTNRYIPISGDYDVDTELAIVTGSFTQINNVIENGLDSLPSLVLNTNNNIKVTNTIQLTSLITGSSTEVEKVSGSVDIIETIVQNGTGSIPTIVENNTDISNLIKVTNTTQFTTGSGADKLQAKIISASFGTVIDILINGTGSLPTIVEYETPIDAPKSVLAYTLLKENIGFIQSESIAFMSSSWSGFEYTQSLCERDLAYIVSGAAEDLIWNSNSASVINGKYYYEYPSQATGSQLDQTITAIKYASNLAQNIVRNRTYVSPSAEVSSSYGILVNNKDFIKNETIAFVSSSWSDFSYNETTCKRDVGYIVDAVATDLLYGGNERSVTAGRYYYDYPSAAIVGGVPSSTQQKDPTVTAINYVKGLVSELVGGAVFQTASNEVEFVYDSIRENRSFIQNETIAFVNAKYPNLEYNEASCSRDTGFIVDAVATDLRWGGNQRSREAGRFYYLFPSKATGVQVEETTDAVTYASDLVKEIVLKNTLPIPSASLNTDNNIKVTNETQYTSASSAGVVEIEKISSSFALVSEIVENGTGSLQTITYNIVDNIKVSNGSQFTGSLSGSLEDITNVSESISIVTNIIANGTGSLPTIIEYTTPSSASSTIAAYEILRENIGFIQDETIAYLSSSWSTASYLEASCRRDVGYIISGAAEDLIWNSNSASVVNGKFYYEIPSQAQGAQLNQTLDGIFYASRLAQKLIQNVVFETASVERRAAWDLLKDNTEFIKEETIAYLSSSWSEFEYSESVCKRDIGYIIDAVRTDVLYGGNERTNKAGEFYYLYPSEATGSQLDQTLDGIRYAGRLAQKVAQNIEFVTASNEASSSWNLLRDNKVFIQNETIAYLSSSWSSFGYNQTTCKRDIGYIVDAVATDILYGGNERSVTAGDFYYRYPSNATTSELEPTTTGIEYAGDMAEKVIVNQLFQSPSSESVAGNETLLRNRSFIQNEVIAYISSSWSGFEYNEASCSRDTGYIVDAVATDFLYGGNERSRTAGEYYFKFPSSATVAGTESPNVNAQLYPTIDGIKFASGIAQKLVQNIEFITASAEVSSSWALMRDNKRFIQEEVIAYVSSSWSGVYYNEDKCKRDVGYLIDAAATDLYYGGNERSVTAGSFYYLFPSRATVKGVPSEEAQLDPTIDGIKYASGLSQKVIQNVTFVEPSASVLTGAELLIGNKELIQTEVIEFLSSSWSEFEYNQAKCYRDVGYIIDGVRTDLVYGGNARSIQAGTFYYYIPSVAITEQKPQTVDGINFAMGMSEQVINKEQLVRPAFLTRQSVDLLRGKKKNLQSRAISYTNGAFPTFVYNEEKCYRDTGFIVDAIATDLFYGGNERSIKAAESYYTGVYGSAAVVVNEQKYETAETNRFLRTQFQKIVRNGRLEQFGSLIITTGHDFSYAGAGVTYKALPPNQGGAGVPDPDKEITELAGGRVYFTSGNELGDFRIGTGLVINQATGTLQGRTFSRSLFSLVTPFSLALEG